MEHPSLSPEMLEKIPYPAFLVQDGIITHANHAAAQRQLETGTAISDRIDTGSHEYEAYEGGKLCLTITAANTVYNASVIRENGADFFCLESEYHDPELRAMALAAQYLREPLSSAMNTAQALAVQSADTKTQELAQHIMQLNRSLHRLHRVVNNMSDAAGYSTQRYSRTALQDATSVIEEIMEKAQLLTEKADRQLSYHGPKHAVHTYLDVEKLERALLNLVSNAVRHSPAGSKISAELKHTDSRLYFSVSNRAAYDSDRVYTNLFTQYLREPSLENRTEGIGLGMAIIRSAAVAHGGAVLCEKIDGQTYRFTMTLAIRRKSDSGLHSPVLLPVDYAGGYDHALLELSDVLPAELYEA